MSTGSPRHRFGSRVLTTLQRAFTVFGVAVALFLVLSPRPLTDASGVPVAVASMLFALATMVRVDGGRATAHATGTRDDDEDDRPDPTEVDAPPTAAPEPTAPDVDPPTADTSGPEHVAAAVGTAPTNAGVGQPDRPPAATASPAPGSGIVAPATGTAAGAMPAATSAGPTGSGAEADTVPVPATVGTGPNVPGVEAPTGHDLQPVDPIRNGADVDARGVAADPITVPIDHRGADTDPTTAVERPPVAPGIDAPVNGTPAALATSVGAGDDTAHYDTARYDLVVRTDSGAALALRVGDAATPTTPTDPADGAPTGGDDARPVTVATLPVGRVGAILGTVTDPLGRSSVLPILVSISLRTEPARAAVSLVDLVRRSGFDPADLVVEVVDGDAADPALHRALAALDGAGMALTWRIDGFDLVDLAQLDGLPITYVSFDLDPLARLGASGTGGAAVATRFAHDLGFDSLARTVPGRVTLVELAGIGFRAAADPSWPDPVPLGEVGGRLRERGVIPARTPRR